ncbi:hypothetical protein [Clostridium beijerinckii]|uniref:DUF2262 domain-containing protein n=1 Tax=Clostridium beijerinckii TaxID=1520 RepID=A0AAX0B123_CLOBE|nr:hypothetical protein [Clostridium beijerinckii]NRT88891.1 hypothetical protein [Clostridium beijerinckii]NYC74346.1 hypothetical protein [Clostridium beijerinckii]
MTIDELEEFIDEEYRMEFAEDKIFCEWRTIEQELESLNKAIQDAEFMDSFEDIVSEIKYLEKYKNKNLHMRYAFDTASCIWGQGWFICKITDNNYEFVDFYRTI